MEIKKTVDVANRVIPVENIECAVATHETGATAIGLRFSGEGMTTLPLVLSEEMTEQLINRLTEMQELAFNQMEN